ncbi:MAG: GNAT family N-acetyltransferase [Chloroflexi bacterium]|nr:GNAT family N-acetyltransferase [Chloroflexota bacterium]
MDEPFFLRPPLIEDAGTIAGLANAETQRVIGGEKFSTEVIRAELNSPLLNLQHDWRVVVGADNRPLASCHCWCPPPFTETKLVLRVHPDFEFLRDVLLDWGEGWAAERFHQMDDVPTMRCAVMFYSADEEQHDFLAERGYRHYRTYWRMHINFAGPIEATTIPAGISITPFAERSDFRALQQKMGEIFGDDPAYQSLEDIEDVIDEWQYEAETNPLVDTDYWFLAVNEAGEIIGFVITATGLADDPDMAFIDTIAVDEASRGQGIGRGLLQHTLRAMQKLGRTGLVLDVDGTNEDAIRLYQSQGMTVQYQREKWVKALEITPP